MFIQDATSNPEMALAAVDDERSGAVFGSYALGAAIGGGAMGTVYRAEHRRLGKPVALKLMAPALRSDAEARQRFLLEAQTTAAIRHRHVIEIVDFGECGDEPYIVMELLDGEDLERHLERRTRMSAREAASSLLPVVAALAAAHDAGVVHRDLKPSNIFLHHDPDGALVPKLLDFGISKQTLTLARGDFQGTSFNQLLGSPHYLPPEAVNGCRDLTPASDQYSFGVVLYEAVTGRAPIQRSTLFELLTAIAGADFTPPSHGLPELEGAMENTILRCMQQDPASRFADVRELGRALLELADARTQLLWQQTFDPARGARVVSDGLALVSTASSTRPPRRAEPPASQRLLALAAVSAAVLSLGGVALLSAAPPSPEVDRSFHAEQHPPAAAPASAPAVFERPAAPEADALAVPASVDTAAVEALLPEPLPPAFDARPAARTRKPAERAARQTASPQRPPRRAVAAPVRRHAATRGAAAGDPLPPPATDSARASPVRPERALPPSRQAADPEPTGANESPIFD